MDFITKPQVSLVAHSASDASVIAAARVSTIGDASLAELTNDPDEAEGLIRFLMKNRHGTPFEHNQFRFYVKAPIFVFREFHRHRIGWSYNEESGRYKQLEPCFYLPGVSRAVEQVGKPGAYTMVQNEELRQDAAITIRELCKVAYNTYQNLLDVGVAKEVARMVLPVTTCSSMYATCNARSLMAFLSLRTDYPTAAFPSKPQYEIQQVAEKLEDAFSACMPLTWRAWNDFGRVAP